LLKFSKIPCGYFLARPIGPIYTVCLHYNYILLGPLEVLFSVSCVSCGIVVIAKLSEYMDIPENNRYGILFSVSCVC